MMFNLTSLFGLTLASLGVAIVGPLSHHYYPALVAVTITVILDLGSRVNDVGLNGAKKRAPCLCKFVTSTKSCLTQPQPFWIRALHGIAKIIPPRFNECHFCSLRIFMVLGALLR